MDSDEGLVDNIWTEYSKSYDRIIPRLHCYQRMLGKILDHTGSCESVIDAGAGTGLISVRFVERGQAVFAFDNNPGMLQLAYERRDACSERERERWRLTTGDAMAYPVDCPVADAVVLNNVLFYCPDTAAALDQAAAHIAPGGIFVATGPKHRPDGMKVFQSELAAWEAAGQDTAPLEPEIRHHMALMQRLTKDQDEMVSFFQPEELVADMRSRGFSTVLEASGEDYYGENFFVALQR